MNLLKFLLLSFALLPGFSRADAVSQALATAWEVDARVKAASAIHTPDFNSVQKAKGEVEGLQPFFSRLASDLSQVHVGPADQVKSVGLDLNVRIETLKGTSSLDLSLFFERCKGISEQLRSLEGMLPSLIQALKDEAAKHTGAIEAATGWKAPEVPGPVNQPGLLRPTPTPFFGVLPPVVTPLPTHMLPPAGPPSLDPATGQPTLLPGGPVIQPPQPTPSGSGPVIAPQVTPTALSPLKVPQAIASLQNGRKVYVANVNAGTVAVLDAVSRRFIKQIPVGSQPAALALDPSGHLLVVANYGSGTASLIDTQSDEVVATLRCGDHPMDVAVVNDGKKAYVANQASGNVTVLDLKKRASGKSIKVGSQPSRVSLAQNSKLAYVSLSGEDAVAVIDTDLDQVVATVSE